MTPAANVLDLFHGDNHERIPDFSKLLTEGIVAIVHKVSEGTSLHDARFVERSKAAADAGMPFYGYHFGTAANGSDQADFFLSAMSAGKDVIGGEIDFEDRFGKRGKLPESQQMSLDKLVAFLKECDQAQEFLTPIYGGNRIREHVSPSTPLHQFFGGRLLHLAEYGPHENLPRPWSDPSKVLWQFSEKGNVGGVAGHVDLNHWPGTPEDLEAAWTAKAA